MQGEQTMRFYEFAQPHRPVLEIIQQAQQNQQAKSVCNECATRKLIKNAFSNLQDLKRRVDTGA